MSEKFKTVGRKIKEELILIWDVIIPQWIGILLGIIGSLICILPIGVVAPIFWNCSMPAIFNFQALTIFNAIILILTLQRMREQDSEIVDFYTISKIQIENCEKMKGEKIPKIEKFVGMLVPTIVLSVILIFITILLVKYSWNHILPNLFNMDLVHINWIQAFGITGIFNLIFGRRKGNLLSAIEKRIQKKVENINSKKQNK